MPMTRLPPKKDVALALLEQATVLVHLDPRGDEVQVPAWFKRQPQLVLQIGLNMPKPIPDLSVDDAGISCTLSFSNTPHYCHLPWTSVYALIGASGRGMVWPDDVPKEVAGQYVVTTPKEEPKPRAALRAVEEPTPDEQAAKADAKKKKRATKAKERKETEKATRATRPRKKPAVVPAPEPQKSPAPRAAAAPAPAVAAAPARRASGGTASAGSKKKRELPPYLRVVK